MRLRIKATMAVGVVMLAFALPGGAGADTKWVCIVEGEPEPVVFVTAADAADHGIRQANATAGVVFHEQFGEDCDVE
jgi:hypothetical protein